MQTIRRAIREQQKCFSELPGDWPSVVTGPFSSDLLYLFSLSQSSLFALIQMLKFGSRIIVPLLFLGIQQFKPSSAMGKFSVIN